MTPKQIKRKADTIKRKSDKLYAELQKLQSECPHEELTGENHANTGNWSSSDDSYWTTYVCPSCGKRWNEDQEESWWDKETREFRTKDGYAYKVIRK
jgi:hypothetical protein